MDGKRRQINIVDRPLPKGRKEVSLSAFAFLFSELVQYAQGRAAHTQDLEKKLEDAGHPIGMRVLELVCYRDKNSRRETKILNILGFISNTVWKTLFGKAADSLEKSTENDDEYMINERDPLVNRFISVPKEYGQLNCGAFVAGIVKGILDGGGFPARVSAHTLPEPGAPNKTTILIKFAPEVMARE
eukprot:TRINITY_DN417_c1_g1_i2.p1 TRINITY_DN417_c1_g1~~TRINITY_DN417_c1_g1_i2.p1  ORF type:complete len:187 (+),score=16.86 TRINITY_DN417_c1_g1_i2:277-837(+)